MEKLHLTTLQRLARIRGLDIPDRTTQRRLVTILYDNAYPNQPFGINPNKPQFQKVLELRIIPLYHLISYLNETTNIQDSEKLSYAEAIYYILGTLDPTSTQALNLFEQNISTLQRLANSKSNEKYELISVVLGVDSRSAGTPAGRDMKDPAGYMIAHGFRAQNIPPEILKPLPQSVFTLSANQLAGAADQHYDISELANTPSMLPMGQLKTIEDAMEILGLVPVNEGSLLERYKTNAQILINFSNYKVGDWWYQTNTYLKKLFPQQRLDILTAVGLGPLANEKLSPSEISFRLSHGMSIGIGGVSWDKIPDDVKVIVSQRPESPMNVRLLQLSALSDERMISTAAQFGMKLPFSNPRAALYRTIFLYEWISPERSLTKLKEAIWSGTADLPLLRQYTDFELFDILPGFDVKTPCDRAELLDALVIELNRPHFMLTVNGVARTSGTPQVPGKEYPWSEFTISDADANVINNLELARNELMQLARILNPSFDGKIQETRVLERLFPFPEEPLPTDAINTHLKDELTYGMVLFGWDGQSLYPLNRSQPNKALVDYADKLLKQRGGDFFTGPLEELDSDGNGVLVGAETTAPGPITIIQNTFVKLLRYGERLSFNPFLIGC